MMPGSLDAGQSAMKQPGAYGGIRSALLPIAMRLARALPLGLGARLAGSSRLRGPLRGLINAIMPDGVYTRVRVVAGYNKAATLELNLKEEKAFWRGMFEPLVEDVLAGIIEPGAVVYDIGANIGYYTILASRCSGADGRVFAFEPDSDNRVRLRRHVELNELSNVQLVPYAVADSSGTERLQRGLGAAMSRLVDVTPPDEPTASGRAESTLDLSSDQLPDLCSSELRLLEAEVVLFATRRVDPGDLPQQVARAAAAADRGQWREAWSLIQAGREDARLRLSVLHEIVDVSTVTLDEFVFEQANTPPNVIKIDVEGAEARVLRGAKRVVEEVRPAILCEVHGIDAGRQIWEFLTERGYQLAEVEAGLAPVTAAVLAVRPGGAHLLATPIGGRPETRASA